MQSDCLVFLDIQKEEEEEEELMSATYILVV